MIDPRMPASHHTLRHRLCDKERGALVQVGDGIVILLGHVEERRGPVGAGIVHQDIERRLRRDRCTHRGQIGHVQHQRLGAAAFRADLCRCGFDLRRCARHEHDMRPGLGQRRRTARPIPRPAPVTSARRPSRRSDGVRGRGIVDPRWFEAAFAAATQICSYHQTPPWRVSERIARKQTHG